MRSAAQLRRNWDALCTRKEMGDAMPESENNSARKDPTKILPGL